MNGKGGRGGSGRLFRNSFSPFPDGNRTKGEKLFFGEISLRFRTRILCGADGVQQLLGLL